MKHSTGITLKTRYIILSLLLVLLPGYLELVSGNGKIVGFVYEAKTNKPLAGANVVILGTQLGAATGMDGRFEISNVADGVYTIEASFMGYKTQRKENIVVKNNITLELIFKLEETPIELSEIVVTPGHFSVMRSTPTSRRVLTRDDIKSISPFGGDIYRAVTRLPGVTGNDFSAKFAVRGGGNEEVLVLFDGLELYEPFHLKDIGGGVLSIIDMEAIGSIDLMTGGFTVEYGNKMSGVFNIHSATEPFGKNRTSLGISLMNARFFTEGQIKGNKGKWLLSARRGYIDVLMKLTGNENDFLPEYYDVLAMAQYNLSENHAVAVNFLRAGDKFKFVDEDDNKANTGYGNSYGWINLKSALTQRLFAQSIVSMGQVDRNRKAVVFTEDSVIQKQVADNRDFTFYGLKQDWTFELADRFFLKWGFDVKQFSSDYDYFKSSWFTRQLISGKTKKVTDTLLTNITPRGKQFSIYLSERMRIFSPLVAEVGVRYDYHSHTGDKTWSTRVNLAYAPASNSAIKLGWGKFRQSQGIHELAVQDGVEKFFPAELAEHRVIGLEHKLANGIEIRVEAYLKKLSHIRPRYINLIGTMDIFPELSGDRTVETPERGQAKGIEFYVKQDTGGKINWWASYCLASVKDWILLRYVPRQYDQRHTIDLNFNYKPNQKWRFNIAWLYHSGLPYTKMYLVDQVIETGMSETVEWILTPTKLREARLADYHRLDVRISRSFKLARGQFSIFLEIINAYNRANVKAFDYNIVYLPEGDVKLEKIEYNWLPILPSVGINWEK